MLNVVVPFDKSSILMKFILLQVILSNVMAPIVEVCSQACIIKLITAVI
jgi:hypothetical protein